MVLEVLEGGIICMNEQGPVSLQILTGVPLGLAKLSFLGQMLRKPPPGFGVHTHTK